MDACTPDLDVSRKMKQHLSILTHPCASLSGSLTEYNISAAAISIFSLAFIILGTVCLIASCSGKGGKGRDYLLKPAGMFYAFAGRRAQLYIYTHLNEIK